MRLFAPRGHRPPPPHLAAYCAAQSATPPTATPAAATAAATPPALATSGGTATKSQGCRDPGQWRYEVGLGDATVRHGGRCRISVRGLPPLACMPCAPSAPRAHRARAAAGREQSHFASGDLLAAKIATDASAAKATGGIGYNHVPGGCNVIYLDGHAEFIKFGEIFPANSSNATLNSLFE